MTDCDRYLRLPMANGKSKVNTFKDLQEKVTKRVRGWKEKFISKVGREILIQPHILKSKRNVRSFGLIGRNYVRQRRRVEWGSAIFTHLT